jgi:prenylcysteine oxidase / farnesylcysteine lyase
METSTLAARNIVDLLLKEEFDSGLCLSAPSVLNGEQEVLQIPPSPTVEAKDFVLGWDC